MKRVTFFAVALVALAATALAQTAKLPYMGGTANQSLVSNGTSSPPAFQSVAARQAALQMPILSVSLTGVDFNAGNTDHAVSITLPTGYTRWRLLTMLIGGASTSLSTATFGVFTSTGAGGVAVVTSGTACTVTATADATANNLQGVAPASPTTSFTTNTVQFRVQTAEGVAATGNVTLTYYVMP